MELTARTQLVLAPDYWLAPGSQSRRQLPAGWLLGAVLALWLWSLPPGFEWPAPARAPLLISLQRVPTALLPPPALSTEMPHAAGPAQPAPGAAAGPTADPLPEPAAPATATRQPTLNLRARASEWVGQWQPPEPAAGDYPVQGTVFDPALRGRLAASAPARPVAADRVVELPNALGETRLIVGDQCVVTQDLDDQAMRGMKLWWVGLCRAPEKPPASSSVRLP